MINWILTITYTVISVVATAQQQTVYFDKNWKPASEKNTAAYFRIVQQDTNDPSGGRVQYHYITGPLEREGEISGVDKDGKEIAMGWWTWYYPNGGKLRRSYFNHGRLDSATYYWNEEGHISVVQHYRNNVLHGDRISYNPDGRIKYLAVYDNGKVSGLTFYEGGSSKVINSYLQYDDEWDYDSFLFREDFIDNRNNWVLKKDTHYSIKMLPHKLALQSGTDSVSGSNIYYPLPNQYDFFIETDLSFEKGAGSTGHGIVWGFQDWNNYDYFLISANGYFKTGAVINGKDLVSNNWRYNTGIFKGKSVNHLRVIKEQDTYIFLANDKQLAKSNFIKMAGDSIGIFVGGAKKSISCNYIQIKTHFGVIHLNPLERRVNNDEMEEGYPYQLFEATKNPCFRKKQGFERNLYF
jgi:hypothetical protein